MNIENDIQDLIELSQAIGVMPTLIQGGGGNISIKASNEIMLIKASGAFLKNVAYKNGISFVNLSVIKAYIDEFEKSASLSISDFIKEKTISYKDWKIERPSIETGFHVVLQKYTIHTHSVYANLLTCTKEGKDKAMELFPDSVWIDYLPPGEALTLAIAKEESRKRNSLYFIENHGIITTASTKDQCLAYHLEINEILKNAFNFTDYEQFIPSDDLVFMRQHVLFPDQVVYTIDNEVIKSVAAQETIKSYFYIYESIITNNLTPNFLSNENVDFINNMESEKYRKGLIR